jgi:hypothetical protein
MRQVFVSNRGDDTNNGLRVEAPIRSWRRLVQLSRDGVEWVFVEHEDTRKRLEKEAAAQRVRSTLERQRWEREHC